jgi:hypothetical protein
MGAFAYTQQGGAFRITFAACERKPESWKSELYAAARAIAERTKKPLWICSSGGIDSEVACRAFHDQKIPFSVLTLEHDKGTNAHDIRYAIEWCEKHGVEQRIVRIDMERFLGEEIDRYAEQFPAIHPFRYLQVKLMSIVSELGGYGVLASGEQLYTADTSKDVIMYDDLYLPLSNGTAMSLEWCKVQGEEHEPYFHFSTPELCLSYMHIPIIDFALKNPDPLFRHFANTYTLKRLAYQSIWPDLPLRYKAHGFDRIRGIYDAATERLKQKFLHQFVPVHLPVRLFREQLEGKNADL